MAESGKAADNARPERHRFPGQPKTMRSMITGLDKAYQGKTVTVKGSEKTGYETVKIPIDQIYSNLKLLPANALSGRVGHASRQGSAAEWERLSHAYHGPGRQTRTPPIKLKDVLRAEGQASRPPRRVLILACAGAGKTMAFTRKATLDWSLGRIWTDKEIVLSFPLRQPEVHKASTLQELLQYYGEWSSAELDEMCVYMRDNVHRVCIILDGLDEIDLQTCSAFVMRIMTGERMPGASVIITSRPSPEVLDLAGENPFDRRIEVIGFQEKDVSRYVDNVLKQADAAEVMRQVNASAYLTTYMRIPVNAVYICSLYRDGYHDLPTTLPSIVSCIILAAIKQKQGKLPGKAAKVPDTWEELSSEFLQPVLELGTFAFSMLADKVVVFEQKHIRQCQLSEEAQSLGLLVSCEDVGRSKTPQWTFAHLTLQEALAARVVSSSLKIATDVTRLMEDLDPLAGHLSTFWRLLAAELKDECLVAQITAILTGQRKPADTRVSAGSTNSKATAPTQSTTAATAVDTKSTTEAKPAADLISIIHLFRARREVTLQLADKLSSFLTTSASERLANALPLDARFVSSSLEIATDVTRRMEYLDPLAGHLSTFWRLLEAEFKDECLAAQITANIARQPQPADTGVSAGSTNLKAAAPTQSTTAATAVDTKSTTEAKPAADLTSITHPFRASRDDMLQLADMLSGFLNTSASERLANALLLDVVDGSGLLAVRAAMPQGSDLTGSSFLHHLLKLWVRRVPLASVHILHRAIASFDQSTADQCFPSCVLAPESPQPSTDSDFQLADLQSEEGKHRLLLALQCYYEFSEAQGQSPIIDSLQHALERNGMDFEDVCLTPSDCRAIAHALQQYHGVVTKVSIDLCCIGDLGYQQLAPGLAKCSNLVVLRVAANNLTGLHCQHISNVIRQNHTTLEDLDTIGNDFTTDDVALLHSTIHLCHGLCKLRIGGSMCTDRAENVAILSAVLSSCQQLTEVTLTDYDIGDSGLSQLQRHFVQLPLCRVGFNSVGLTAESSSVLCCILHEHRHYLTTLVLSHDALSDSFLLKTHAALAECSQLRFVMLLDIQITSLSLSVLAALLPRWPSLATLWLSNNDFSEYAEAAQTLNFVEALNSCPLLQRVWMPVLVNPVLQALLACGVVDVVYTNVGPPFAPRGRRSRGRRQGGER